MSKLKLPRIVFPVGAMEYPNCMDLLMAHILAMQGVTYQNIFSNCLKATLDTKGKTISKVLMFSSFGLDKYRSVGIKINCVNSNDKISILEHIVKSLNSGIPAVVHFDAFYCKWDHACYGRRHNDHLVMVTGLTKFNAVICDPYFKKYRKRIGLKRLLGAMRFYYQIKIPNTISFPCEEELKDLQQFVEVFDAFVRCVSERKKLLRLNTELGFVSEVYETLQRGRIGLYYYSIYLAEKAQKTHNNRLREICRKLAEADCLWVNCLLYIVRGARTYYSAEELYKHLTILNAFLKTIFNDLPTALCTGDFIVINSTKELLSESDMNCKMFTADDECALSDFIENEKLCVVPKTNLSEVGFGDMVFRALQTKKKDNLRCLGQTISCNVRVKGLRLFMLAEWIDANASIGLKFADESFVLASVKVSDFPKREHKSIDLGAAYDEARYKAFDHVFARVIEIPFHEEKQLTAIILPCNAHLHILSAEAIL